MSCEDCLSRRKFLASAAGAAGLVMLAGCGDGVVSGVAPRNTGGGGPTGGGGGGGGPLVIKVSDFPGLATNNLLVAVNAFTAVKRTGAATFEAFSMTCTHAGCLVDIVNGAKFVCPCHGSEFSNTGAVTHDPATTPLDKFTTSYDPASDQLTIS